jgi:expansin (peptidoglycan-binding protein)
VFGDAPPAETRSGLDLSPAAAAALGLDGRGRVSWRFVPDERVPDGPWTEIETTRGGVR